MEFHPYQEIHGFTVETVEDVAEIDGQAIVMRHAASGARLAFLKNDDANKSFSITFKTPPADDTGVFHILEHSVLCGSEKYPVKEPFVNLLRTSMQTFLNAMTFPDKTMYPVASTNDKDLLNLIDVYMDAVLNPRIYEKRAIFEQEGWHYELDGAPEPVASDAHDAPIADDGPDAPIAPDSSSDPSVSEALRYNGVVFNEMKGALSDPESVLVREMNHALFPNTCYAFESGGHPRAIPTLTYEGFLDTHARHYRLDNSFIILYGAIDADQVLGFLDERYLSVARPRTQAAPNAIGAQEPVCVLDAVVPMDTAPENACVGAGYVIGKAHDFERVLACDILLDALMGGNESPLKRRLLDEGLGGDVSAYLMDSQAQPVALFYVRSAHEGAARRFLEVIEEESARLAREGIARDVLEASISQMAFSLRERDRGMADGVPLAMNVMAGWLYDDDDPLAYLRYEAALERMRAGLDDGYFEDVLEALVPGNVHKALVEIRPQAEEGEGDEARELAARLASLSDGDKASIRADVAMLRELQERPDSPEELACLPVLHISDIGPATPDPAPRLLMDASVPYLYHDLPTRRIDYVSHYFDINRLTWEDLPYISILTSLLGRLGTDGLSAADVDVRTRSRLGSLRAFTDIVEHVDDPTRIELKLVVSASALSEEVGSLAFIPQDIWSSTCFDDAGRIRDILVQRRVSMEQDFAANGHAAASRRLASYQGPSGAVQEAMGGVDFYRFLRDLIDHFDERFDDLRERLNDVRARAFTMRGLMSSFTGPDADRAAFWKAAGDMGLAMGADGRPLRIPFTGVKNEAFVVPTDVAYVAKGADVSGCTRHSGSWAVLSSALSFDYLWNEVRVKGGAYGTGFRRAATGSARFHSYRDPGIDGTIARFDAAGAWLAEFSPDADEMEGYVVSTTASHDAPVKPRQIARRSDQAYFRGDAPDARERRRNEILATTPETLRGYAVGLDAIARDGAVCVFGNEAIIKAAKTDLMVVDLFNE